ncbi:hypothetical protein AB0K34_41075, partial [Actinomadura sp. NPDC049382]|uniref:hypothetical protein n=1 Tax=Actinomadura sp. NPDC049382 TaxID=3158220 RepID=UPI0034381C83
MEDQKVAPLDDVAPTPAAPTKTDLPVVTDPAAYAAEEAPAGAGPGEPAAADADRAGIARLGDPVAVWPCGECDAGLRLHGGAPSRGRT